MATNKFSLQAILSLTDQLSGPYKKTTTNVIGLNDRIGRSVNGLSRGIVRGFDMAATIGIGALIAGVGLATREFVALDDSITAAGAKFSDVDKRDITAFNSSLKELRTSAREVGAVTEFSAVDAAGALDKFAMAGMSSEQSMALLMGTTNLATSAGTDLTTAVDIATDSLGAFGVMTSDTVQLEKNLAMVSDQMAKTTVTANTSLTELFEAVGNGAKTFTQAGQSIATFNSFTGVLANSSKKGGEAGTLLRNVMLRLGNPSAEAAKEIERLGVVTSDSDGNFRDIVDIIADFEKGLKGMGTEQRTAALGTIFGTKTVDGFNILLAEGSDKLRDYRERIEDSTGASLEMATVMRQSLGNRLKVIKSGLTELGLQFVETFEVDGKNGLDALAEGIQNFDMTPIISGAQKTLTFVKEWGPRLASAAPTLLGIAAGIKAITIANGLLNTSLLASPIGQYAAAVAALWVAMDKFEKKFGMGAKIVEERGGGIYSREFEENRRERLRQRQFEASEADPRRARQHQRIADQAAEQEIVRQREIQTQRYDLFINTPPGFSASMTPGGAPAPAIQLGAQ